MYDVIHIHVKCKLAFIMFRPYLNLEGKSSTQRELFLRLFAN